MNLKTCSLLYPRVGTWHGVITPFLLFVFVFCFLICGICVCTWRAQDSFQCHSQECCLPPSSLSLVYSLSIRPDRTASKVHGVTSLPVLCRDDTRLLSVSHLRQGLWGSGCPETHYIDQAGLELGEPPDSASQVLLKHTQPLPSRKLTFLIHLPFFSEGRYLENAIPFLYILEICLPRQAQVPNLSSSLSCFLRFSKSFYGQHAFSSQNNRMKWAEPLSPPINTTPEKVGGGKPNTIGYRKHKLSRGCRCAGR